MADPRLAAWRAAAEAATEPPWTWGWLDGTAMTETYTVRRADPACEVLARTSRYKQGYEDAEFIAAARTAVPVLLDLVDRLEADNQQLRDENQHLQRRVIDAGSLLNEGTYDHDRDEPCRCSSCLTLRLLREPFGAVSDGD